VLPAFALAIVHVIRPRRTDDFLAGEQRSAAERDAIQREGYAEAILPVELGAGVAGVLVAIVLVGQLVRGRRRPAG